MAASKPMLDVDDLQDTFLECPVCVKHFNQTDRRPRLLNTCLHAFCTPCLEKLLQKGQITCPVCRRVDKIRGKADGLRVDPVRSNLIDYLHMKQKKGVLCTECNENTAVAVSQCKECKAFLCKQCDFIHKNHRVSRGHTIIPVEEILKQPMKSFSKGRFCEIHPQHQIEFFCTSDGKLCCVSCTVLDHKGHDLQKLKESADDKKRELEADVSKLQHVKNGFKDAKVEEERQKKTIKDTKAKSLADIESMFNEIQIRVSERKHQLLADVIDKSNNLSAVVEKNAEANDQSVATLESTETYFRQAREKADEVDMLQMYPSIKRSLTGLGGPQQVPDFEASIQDFTFQKTSTNEVATVISQLGQFYTREKTARSLGKSTIQKQRKQLKGVREFMKLIDEMAEMSEFLPPAYWKHDQLKTGRERYIGMFRRPQLSSLVTVDKATFNAIDKVIQTTLDSTLVGHGKDAVNLHHSNIRVKQIERLENPELFSFYSQRRSAMFRSARDQGGPFTRIEKLPGSKCGVRTTRCSPPELQREVFPEVNEHYLFHGTEIENIQAILAHGLDPRVGSKGKLGSGVYGAESSTKADQYTDDKRNRTTTDKQMLLMRVLLGQPVVTSIPRDYCRPPCRDLQHLDDRCRQQNHGFFDSVIADGAWNFRDFVVYDGGVCYPEYVITYTRV